MFTVLISGELGAGKTTTVNLLTPELTKIVADDVLVMSGNFADELKRECAERAAEPLDTFYTEQGKEKMLKSVGMTAGRLLQVVGEEARQKNPNHWIERLRQRATAEWRASGRARLLLVVGDCRHPNEIDDMKPGLAVRLEGDPGGARARSTRDLNHPSETALRAYEGFDIRINTETTPAKDVVASIVAPLLLSDKSLFK
jgi:hypothetical protein